MRTEITTTIDSKLLLQWTKLWEQSSFANYTNSPFWFLAVTEAFGHSNYVCISLFDNTSLVAIGVLYKKRKYLTTIYTVEPGDFVCGNPFLLDEKNKKAIRVFAKALSQLGTVLLDNVPEEFASVLVKAPQKGIKIHQAINHYLTLIKDKSGNAEIPNRKILMRRVRANEEHFLMRSFDGNTPEGLKTAIAIDTISNKQTGGYNTFSNKMLKDFFASLAKNFGHYMSFNILYFDKVPIAFEVGFVIKHTYFGNQISFSAEYKKFSPGKVMVVRLIEYLTSKNIQTMDLGSGDAHLKRLIASDSRQLYHVILSDNKALITYIKTRKNIKSSFYYFFKTHPQVYSLYRKLKNREK